MTVRDDLLEIFAVLEAEGCRVSVVNGRLAVEGVHDDLSARARVALETLVGRTPAVKRVLAEGPVDPDAHARVERQREELAAMRAARPEPEAERCVNGHAKTEANTYHRPQAGHGGECVLCRAARVRLSKRKSRARLKREEAASPKKPGPAKRSRCARELHPLDEANTYTAADGRRRCRACVSRRDREKRNHMSVSTVAAVLRRVGKGAVASPATSPPPMPISLEARS